MDSGLAGMGSRTLSRRLVAVSGLVALAIGLFGLINSAAPALASNEAFCEWFSASPGNEGCHDPNLRLITRVNVRTLNGSGCAGAINTNGNEVGGWACTPPEQAAEASNGNYNGSLWLYGRILNNNGGYNTLAGHEWFN